MKLNTTCLKSFLIIFCNVFFICQAYAQTAGKSNIAVNQSLALPVKTIPTIGWNGYKANQGVYPLKISNTDTLFFNRQADRDFVKTGITTAGVTSITKVILSNPAIKYGGRPYNFYYYCNAVNNGYFTVTGLTGKQNTTFTVSYSASNKLYTVIRNYNGHAYSEAVSTYNQLATSLATDLTNFNGTEYLDEPLANVGSFFFFLSRPVVLTAPFITAGGPTTFVTGGSVTLTSSASYGNTWYANGIAIPGANATTYLATTAASYMVKTTASGFNSSFSNTITVTVTAPAIAPLRVAGNKLTDHSGKPVMLCGINTSSYHSGFQDDAQAISDNIKNHTRVNCVRLYWNSPKGITAIQVNNPGYNPSFFTLPYLDKILGIYTANHILPVLMLHDLTDLGDNSTAGFNNYVVPFWTDPNLIIILKKYQNNLIINLQNEWGATWDGLTGATFVNTYQGLITQLRTLNINCPIMVDAPDGGANSQFLIANGQAVINTDPLKNILLSVHTYWSQENGAITNCPADYVTYIKAMANSNLPFVLGEVSDWAVRGNDGEDIPPTPPITTFACPGANSANKYAVDYDAILTEASNDGIGFFAWSWYQDGNIVRNIYDQDTGTTINTPANAGTWPADILSAAKIYGLNNPSIINPFY